uniref:Uncharacterized protein n=1 Tax=Sphaeramia orbicularis TaxID=375764 RepID=A0A673AUB4_9TELE
MYGAVTLFIFMCLAATTNADHHQHCRMFHCFSSISNESLPTNHSLGDIYEIDTHPLDIPDDAKYYGTVTAGSRTIEGEGIKIKYGWEQFHYSMSVTMGCLPMTTFYFTEPTSFLFSLVEVEHEIKDPDLLVVPSFCENQPLEETPEGTVNSFLNEFV